MTGRRPRQEDCLLLKGKNKHKWMNWKQTNTNWIKQTWTNPKFRKTQTWINPKQQHESQNNQKHE